MDHTCYYFRYIVMISVVCGKESLVVIQKKLFCVSLSMYDQLLAFEKNLLAPNLLQKICLLNLANKDNPLNRTDDWKDLLAEVATKKCRASFRKIFDYFYPALVLQITKSGFSKELACEFAQESMIRVWGQAKSYDSSKGNVAVWIYVIARNVKFDYVRKHKKDFVQTTSHDIYGDLGLSFAEAIGPQERFDLEKFKDHLQKLSREQSDVIHKIYFEGMTQQEVAALTGIPIGTIKSRIRLAISSLRDFVEDKSK